MTEIVISNLGMLHFHLKVCTQHGSDVAGVLHLQPPSSSVSVMMDVTARPSCFQLQSLIHSKQGMLFTDLQVKHTQTFSIPLMVLINNQLNISNLYNMID